MGAGAMAIGGIGVAVAGAAVMSAAAGPVLAEAVGLASTSRGSRRGSGSRARGHGSRGPRRGCTGTARRRRAAARRLRRAGVGPRRAGVEPRERLPRRPVRPLTGFRARNCRVDSLRAPERDCARTGAIGSVVVRGVGTDDAAGGRLVRGPAGCDALALVDGVRWGAIAPEPHPVVHGTPAPTWDLPPRPPAPSEYRVVHEEPLRGRKAASPVTVPPGPRTRSVTRASSSLSSPSSSTSWRSRASSAWCSARSDSPARRNSRVSASPASASLHRCHRPGADRGRRVLRTADRTHRLTRAGGAR